MGFNAEDAEIAEETRRKPCGERNGFESAEEAEGRGVACGPKRTGVGRGRRSIVGGEDFDVVEGGGFATITQAFDTDFISGAEGDSGHDSAGRGGPVDAARGQTIGGGPLVDELVADGRRKRETPSIWSK